MILITYLRCVFTVFKEIPKTFIMEGKANLGFDTNEKVRRTSFLEVDASDANAHTYVYNPNMSFTRMTIEALPSEEGIF